MKKLDIVKKTVQILSSVSYENYSDEKTKTYLEYIEGSRADEDRLISPILLRKFLGDVLSFELGKTIATQESKGVGKPDYIPVDTRTHPFVFDAKGTDTRDLSQHYPQIKKYIESQGLKYGILTNMRDLDVYTSERGIEIEEYNFNFVQLYRDYKQNPITCLEEENTKRFLNFVESFSYTPLTKEKKIARIARAKPWSGDEELNTKALTDQLRHIVNILHTDVKEQKSDLLSMTEAGEVSAESIAYEIESITSQISGGETREVSEDTLNEILSANEGSPYGKAQEAFFRRVAYFAMTRLLLARVWEDIGFIGQSLYDGGFAKWYENFNYEIRRVLHYAFDLSAERYPWLFKANNNYSWYEPSDDALIDSLYGLSNFYLGKLDQDILGTIYEDYIERVDKKNKGQYYTPREIVSFIWDRVGYTKSKAFFWYIEGKRRPKLIFDPATGSGGFLVEAARRIRECPEFDWNDPQDLLDIHQAILWYIFGSEISSFPYYLTQVNLLIQLTPVIRRIVELGEKKPREKPTPLGIICRDSLELHNEEQRQLEEGIEDEKEESEKGILHLPGVEKILYDKIKNKLAGKFYYVCANPPYVGEKGHKELFRHTISSYPYWNKYHQGKMDYLYWFIILGLSKLRDYGKLGFITSAYWPTADSASKLRKYILDNAKIEETIFFEEVKIFEHAKGQHNMIFILTKCSGEDKKKERENNLIKIVLVQCKNQDLLGDTIRENLDFLTKHIQSHINESEYEDEYIKVFWSGFRQGELSKDGNAWNEIFIDRKGRTFVDEIESRGVPLEKVLTPYQGIVPNPDRTTPQNIKFLPSERDVKTNEGVFVLNDKEISQLSLTPKEKELIKPSYRNSEVSLYLVDIPKNERIYLIYIWKNHDIEDCPNIKTHLERYMEILQKRREVKEGKIPWYSLHWPRDEGLFKIPKIVCSNWGNQWQPFAFQEEGYYERRDITFFVPKPNVEESIFYFLAILNSSLIRKWGKEKLKQKGYMRQKLQEKIPIHRINFKNPTEAKMHNEIVNKIKSIRDKMTELAKYSKYFSDYRLTKLDFDAPLPKVDNEEIIKNSDPENMYSIRTHPEIKIEKTTGFEDEKFYLSKVDSPETTLTGKAQIKLTGKDRSIVFIMGPSELLRLLASLLDNWKSKPWNEIKENLLLPESFESFKAQKMELLNKVQGIREEISELQGEIDQIVYELYRLTEDEIKIVEGEKNKRR